MTLPFFNQTLPDDIETSQHHVVVFDDRAMLLLDHRVSTVFINQSGNQPAEFTVRWCRIARFHLEGNTSATTFQINVKVPFLLPVLKTAPGDVDVRTSHVDEAAGRSLVIGPVNDRQHEIFVLVHSARAGRIASRT